MFFDNSFFYQKDKILRMIKWGHMNACTSWFETQSINVFFLFFTCHLWHPHQTCRTINFLLNRLGSQNQECRLLEQINQWLTFTFQWTLNKQRCNCERMRDKNIKFIHFISIVTVVYSNGINLKILMSHWRHLTTTFKLPHA